MSSDQLEVNWKNSCIMRFILKKTESLYPFYVVLPANKENWKLLSYSTYRYVRLSMYVILHYSQPPLRHHSDIAVVYSMIFKPLSEFRSWQERKIPLKFLFMTNSTSRTQRRGRRLEQNYSSPLAAARNPLVMYNLYSYSRTFELFIGIKFYALEL